MLPGLPGWKHSEHRMTGAEGEVLKFMDMTPRRGWERGWGKGRAHSGFLEEVDSKSWEAEGWVRRARAAGGWLEGRTRPSLQGGLQALLTPWQA